MAPILEVVGLSTQIRVPGGLLQAVHGVDLALEKGEVLGLIGESGSGKTMVGLSILRLLPETARSEATLLRFQGRDIGALSSAEFRALRGQRLAMVFQNPAGAFNPAKSIGWHLRAILGGRLLKAPPPYSWRTEAETALGEVGIDDPSRTLKLYPHQLSGGMLQRVLIAMVLALGPEVIIADEPTTNLDNIVERQILLLFRRLRQRLAAGIIFITHDMRVASALCDRIMVMYAGEIVETGRTRAVLESPKHPYTQGLVATASALSRGGRLQEIPGELPSGFHRPAGCLFAPRCSRVHAACRTTQPPMLRLDDGRGVRCVLYA